MSDMNFLDSLLSDVNEFRGLREGGGGGGRRSPLKDYLRGIGINTAVLILDDNDGDWNISETEWCTPEKVMKDGVEKSVSCPEQCFRAIGNNSGVKDKKNGTITFPLGEGQYPGVGKRFKTLPFRKHVPENVVRSLSGKGTVVWSLTLGRVITLEEYHERLSLGPSNDDLPGYRGVLIARLDDTPTVEQTDSNPAGAAQTAV